MSTYYKEQKKDLPETSFLLRQNEGTPKENNRLSGLPRIPSTGRKMAVMTACILLHIIIIGIGYGLAVMYTELIDVFNSKRADASLVQSLFMGISTGGGILWSGVMRRFGPGPCTVFGALVGCIGVLASSFATYLTTVILTTGILAGTGLSICYLVPFITISWVFHDDPGLPLAILTLGSSIGQFSLPLIYDTLISEFQWSGTFMVLSAVVLNCIPCGILIYHSRDFFVTGTRTDGDASSKKTTKYDCSLLKDVVIYIMLINFFLIALTANSEALFMVDIMMSRGFERSTGSLIVSLVGFSNLIGRICGGLLRMKCKSPTVYHWIYLLPILAVSHALVINVYDFGLLCAACVLNGISFGITVSQAPTIMFEASGLDRYPLAVALMSLMYGFGNLFAGLLGGSIKDIYGVYDPAFYIAVAASLYIAASTVVAACLMRRRKRLEAGYHSANGNVLYTIIESDKEN